MEVCHNQYTTYSDIEVIRSKVKVTFNTASLSSFVELITVKLENAWTYSFQTLQGG